MSFSNNSSKFLEQNDTFLNCEDALETLSLTRPHSSTFRKVVWLTWLESVTLLSAFHFVLLSGGRSYSVQVPVPDMYLTQ